MYVCMHTISLLIDRLPKNQECHEMWSRKKRKKEAAAAAAAGGGAKEGAGSSNGSAAGTGTTTGTGITTATANTKLTLSDLSRSRSQSGSPVKEPHQQRSGSVGPSRNIGGDGSSSLPLSQLANGALQPASKPQGGGGGGVVGGGGPPPQASLASQTSQQHQLHNIPAPHGTAGVLVPPPSSSSGPPGSNLKQYPLNQSHPPSLIPPTGVGGTVLPPQLHPHAPVVNPPLHPPRGGAGEPQPIIQNQQLGVPVPASAGGVGVGGGVVVEGVQVKQAHKTLANPNIKPSLTVPLPTVPLSASILESLHDASSKVDTTGTGGGGGGGGGGEGSSSSTNNNSSGNGNSTAGGAKIEPTISTAAGGQGQLKDPTNAMGAQGSTTDRIGAGDPGVGVMVSSSAPSQQQIQQVIDAQRTQLALLSQKITQLVTEQKLLTNPLQDSGGGGGGPSGMMRGQISSMAPGLGGYPSKPSSIALRTQTFDYGNRSNKVLENAAVQQLEQDYYHGDQSGRNY